MKHILSAFLALFFVSQSFAQITATILDSTTKEPVPYVNIWVENENIGTSADENGLYTLPKIDASKIVIFSAVGYAEIRIKVADLASVLHLSQKAVELDELLIQQKRNLHKHIVNPMELVNETYFSSTCPDRNPWMIARYMPYREEYAKTPFLSEIKFLTNSEARNAIFYVRLYSIDKKGNPGDLLHDEPIMGKAISKKKSVTTVNVSKLNIRFPETGFFVAIEWLIIKRNEFTMYTARSGKKGQICYTPVFKNVYTRGNVGKWVYQKGKWEQSKGLHDNKFFTIAVELTLTD